MQFHDDYGNEPVYLCYEKENKRIGLSQVPYFFNIDTDESKLISEDTRFRIMVDEHLYLSWQEPEDVYDPQLLNLQVAEYNPMNENNFKFHFAKSQIPDSALARFREIREKELSSLLQKKREVVDTRKDYGFDIFPGDLLMILHRMFRNIWRKDLNMHKIKE